jgi:hypothetical protein
VLSECWLRLEDFLLALKEGKPSFYSFGTLLSSEFQTAANDLFNRWAKLLCGLLQVWEEKAMFLQSRCAHASVGMLHRPSWFAIASFVLAE